MASSPAAILADALVRNHLADPLGETVLADLDAAYAVQREMIACLNEPMAGWKIGATNAKSQQLMGLRGPFYGPMPERFRHSDGASIPLRNGLIGAEIEIAFKLAKALPSRDAAYSMDDIVAAIDGVYPAIEVIGLRQRWQGVPEGRHAIADLGANCIFVHAQNPVPGLVAKLQENPAAISARCLVDGQETGAGDGSLVLGDPLKALLWLADEGPGLAAGDWISTGTLTGLAPIRHACEIIGDFGDIGQVRLSLTD